MITPTCLGYMVINASNLDAWEIFARKIVGFQVGERTDTMLKLRMDKASYRFMIEKGNIDDVTAAGWQFDTFSELQAYVEQVRANGGDVIQGDAALAAARGVHHIYHCTDPNNLRHEFYCDPVLAMDKEPFVSEVLQSRFIAERFGLGHFVEVVKDFDASFHFLQNVMGLRLSGYMRPTGTPITVAFFHTKTGRFHSIAIAALPMPKLCAHIGLEIEDLNDIGLANDRAMEADVAELTIGHHPNAKTTSFYMRTPSDFWLEMGYGEVIIDDDNWHIETHAELSAWGHKPARPDRVAPWSPAEKK